MGSTLGQYGTNGSSVVGVIDNRRIVMKGGLRVYNTRRTDYSGSYSS